MNTIVLNDSSNDGNDIYKSAEKIYINATKKVFAYTLA